MLTVEAFSILTEMIWLRLDPSSIMVDKTKSKSQEKHDKLSLNFNTLFYLRELSDVVPSIFASPNVELVAFLIFLR